MLFLLFFCPCALTPLRKKIVYSVLEGFQEIREKDMHLFNLLSLTEVPKFLLVDPQYFLEILPIFYN